MYRGVISFIEYIVLLKMKRYCTVLHFDIQIDDSNQRRGWRGFVLVSRVNPHDAISHLRIEGEDGTYRFSM